MPKGQRGCPRGRGVAPGAERLPNGKWFPLKIWGPHPKMVWGHTSNLKHMAPFGATTGGFCMAFHSPSWICSPPDPILGAPGPGLGLQWFGLPFGPRKGSEKQGMQGGEAPGMQGVFGLPLAYCNISQETRMTGTLSSWQGRLSSWPVRCKWVHNVGLGSRTVWLGYGAAWPYLSAQRLLMAHMGAQPGHAISRQGTPYPSQATP